ncbi:thiolase family protein [Nocardia carnea]|uniref:thiolase family protein n=1 Tax=Nocardia carnea TaxID=37328 RepID=UPI002457710C|nr:acetyl-CoA C-acyltransferase [Nocardia carnea]
MPTAVIVDIVRTPSGRGKPGGGLAGVHSATLLAELLEELISRNGVDPALIDDVIAGCVTQSGEQAFNIARTAVLAAGLPESVPATTVDRQCGSSQQAAHFAAQGVIAGVYDIAIACGVESMSRTPMFSNGQGADANRGPLTHRYPDGLVQQGIAAEVIAARWKLDRVTLDEFAARSHERADSTARAGGFDTELVAAGTLIADETVRPTTTAEKLASLPPAFAEEQFTQRFPEIGWSITAGNSSPLTDGAAAALIMSETMAARLGLRPRARFHRFAVVGDDPLIMLTAVVPATRKILAGSGLAIDEIDVYEVNEAFAPVPLMWARELGADPQKLNPRGGAIALGHPLGASGIRILSTMVNHLEQTGGRYGLMTMCEAGGLANATLIESLA